MTDADLIIRLQRKQNHWEATCWGFGMICISKERGGAVDMLLKAIDKRHNSVCSIGLPRFNND